MAKLIFLIGVRGAGKTTSLDALKNKSDFVILKPSTTRTKRTVEDAEYHFVNDWKSDDFAWDIELDGNKYGMSFDELDKVPDNRYGLTVFDPSSIDRLNKFRESYKKDILTIGVDTIDSTDKQQLRVNGDSARILSETEFFAQRNIVLNCDVVLRGSTEAICNGIIAIVECLNSKGGVINRSLLERFLKADILLENALDKYQPASHDLRLGEDVWCQGKFSTLSKENPVLKIPPYSYVIVSAIEKSNLPCFITARFDLKNSLFFQGVILSNGPQIDPGYRGALFCMLYNGSDKPVGIKYGDHFATIEFITTTGVSLGYRDIYQGKTRICEFMPSDAAVSEGGKILERTESKIEKVEAEWKSFRTIVFTILGIAIALIVGPGLTVAYKSNDLLVSLGKNNEELNQELTEIKELKKELLEIIKDKTNKNKNKPIKTHILHR